jgi:hypothetical protein
MRNRTVGPLAVLAVAARRERLEGRGNFVSTLSSGRLSHSTVRAPAITVGVPLGQSRLIGPERTATRVFPGSVVSGTKPARHGRVTRREPHRLSPQGLAVLSACPPDCRRLSETRETQHHGDDTVYVEQCNGNQWSIAHN